MMRASFGTKTALIPASDGKKIAGFQRNADRQMDDFSALYVTEFDKTRLRRTKLR